MDWGIGWRSGALEEREVPRGCARVRGEEAEMERILAIAAGRGWAAMMVKGPPQFGQCSRSISRLGTGENNQEW